MVLAAMKEYDIDTTQSFIIGDKQRDIDCGEKAGVQGYLFTGVNFADFVDEILAERNGHGGV